MTITTATTTNTNVVTECTLYAIVLLIALYCLVSDEIKCAPFGLSCKCSKIYENEANAAGKLDTRSESRKRAFDHHDTLET
jgi:hypothetical protein